MWSEDVGYLRLIFACIVMVQEVAFQHRCLVARGLFVAEEHASVFYSLN
jgi:hypothetical protein